MESTASTIPVIEIEPRSETGTRAAKRLRSEGLIPSVVYHKGEESLMAAVPRKEFLRIAGQSRSSQIFSLQSKDSRLNGRTALVKEVSRDYIGNAVLHIDFQSLKENEEISVRVPIRVVGDAYGVKTEGGILTVSIHDIGVRCFPRQIPSELVVDVTDLHLGKSIHAGEVKLPSGVRLEDEPDETIVSVVAVRVVEEAPAAAAAGEGAAEEGAAAAAGAAPAAGAAAAPAAAADKKKDKK